MEDKKVRITRYSGNDGIKTTSGTVVTQTSAYAKVTFDIKSILDGTYIGKSRDIYCTLEVN